MSKDLCFYYIIYTLPINDWYTRFFKVHPDLLPYFVALSLLIGIVRNIIPENNTILLYVYRVYRNNPHVGGEGVIFHKEIWEKYRIKFFYLRLRKLSLSIYQLNLKLILFLLSENK